MKTSFMVSALGLGLAIGLAACGKKDEAPPAASAALANTVADDNGWGVPASYKPKNFEAVVGIAPYPGATLVNQLENDFDFKTVSAQPAKLAKVVFFQGIDTDFEWAEAYATPDKYEAVRAYFQAQLNKRFGSSAPDGANADVKVDDIAGAATLFTVNAAQGKAPYILTMTANPDGKGTAIRVIVKKMQK